MTPVTGSDDSILTSADWLVEEDITENAAFNMDSKTSLSARSFARLERRWKSPAATASSKASESIAAVTSIFCLGFMTRDKSFSYPAPVNLLPTAGAIGTGRFGKIIIIDLVEYLTGYIETGCVNSIFPEKVGKIVVAG
jgi:hypothetical protein